jgi:hypothetical protein
MITAIIAHAKNIGLAHVVLNHEHIQTSNGSPKIEANGASEHEPDKRAGSAHVHGVSGIG